MEHLTERKRIRSPWWSGCVMGLWCHYKRSFAARVWFSRHLYVLIIMLMLHALYTYLMISCISYRLYAVCTEMTDYTFIPNIVTDIATQMW